MTNEQRESIDYLKESVLIYKNTIPKISDAIDTVLSLIKEQQEEIEKLKVNLAKSCADRTLDRETLKNQENENLEALYRAYNEEIKKKDMQIDLMAEKLAKAYHYKMNECSLKKKELNNIDCNKYKDCTSCIKQYFEDKVNSSEQN